MTEDLRKAHWYILREIERVEFERIRRVARGGKP